MTNLARDPQRASEPRREAQRRLSHRLAPLTEDAARSASRLPGWSVGHVLTHLAPNADAHAGRLEGALRGIDVPSYRDGEVSAGSRPGSPAAGSAASGSRAR